MKTDVLERLKTLDSQSVKFKDAHEILLKEGYTESDIVTALYAFPYDGKPNVPLEQDKIKKFYSENPAAAEGLARTLVKSMKEDDRYDRASKIAVNLAASRMAPGYHAQSVYRMRAADAAGVPYFSTFFITGLSFILVLKFDLPMVIVYVTPFAYMIIWVLLNWWRNR